MASPTGPHIVRCCIVALAIGAVAASAQAQTIFVDDDAPTDPGPFNPNLSNPMENGSDEFPFDQINEAIDAAENGDTIVVRPGTYFDTEQLNTDGKAITITSSGGRDVTFLDGFATSGSMIFMDSNEGRDTVIERLTIQGGFDTNGGALEIAGNVSATFRDIRFRNNTASVDGGVMFINGGTGTVNEEPLFVDCLFEDNTSQSTDAAGWDGGVGFIINSAPTFLRCTFRNNSGAQGGALAFGTCHRVDIIDCLFEDNGALFDGGAVKFTSCPDVNIVGSTFRRNDGNGGGAIDLFGSNTLVDRCRFFGNSVRTASSRGGAILTDEDTLTVTNSVFVGNTSMDDGAAVSLRDNTVAFFENCTITANVAADGIGGILPDSSSRSTVLNSIVTGNIDLRPTGTPDWGGTGTTAAYTASYSIVDTAGLPGGTFGANLFTATAADLFVRVPDAGMDGVWGTEDDDYGDLGLLPNAIAIDAGSSTDYTGPLADLEANDRAQDDPDVPDIGLTFQEPVIDMGAFERPGVQPIDPNACVADFNADGQVDGADFGTFGTEFGRTDCDE